MSGNNFKPYEAVSFSEEEMQERAQSFYEFMDKRRSLRQFSDKPVPKELIKQLIMTASTSPSGAHKQPWTFCAVSDSSLKKLIRIAAEEEEFESYNGRMSDEWLNDLKPFDTDWHKAFLETAPWLIIVFRRIYEEEEEGKKHNNYYVTESVGLACGMLLTAIHNAGLVALTHTPSPMNFLSKLLERSKNEKPFLLIPVGYPDPQATVPVLTRKPAEEVIVYYEDDSAMS